MSIKELTITSDPHNLLKVENYLQQLRRECKICDQRFSDILISITEAVNNAIIHGNKVDKSKVVCIKSHSGNENLILTVSDEGNGFCLDNIDDPLAKENIERCGGRGVLIMSALCDKIDFKNNGSTVKLIFREGCNS